MRFSSVFQLPAVPSQSATAAPEAAPADEAPVRQQAAAAEAVPGTDLPDDLDARVRLIGEWQLGEAC
jgi:hypothetical protein